MQLNELKHGQLARITCKAVNGNTLITWVDEIVAFGELIRFTNYNNYGGEWTITNIDKIDTYKNCKIKFGKEANFLSKIDRGEKNAQNENQASQI